MKRVVVTALLIGILVGVGLGAEKEEIEKDLKAMQGDWAADSFVRDGMVFPEDDARSFFRTNKGDRYTMQRFSKKVGSGKVVLDPSKSPREIDFLPDPPFKGKPILGIYKLEKGKLTMCYAPSGSKRPTTFTSEPGSGVTLIVWVRE